MKVRRKNQPSVWNCGTTELGHSIFQRDFIPDVRARKMAGLVEKTLVLAKNLAVAAKPKLVTFSRYAKVELTPPTLADIPAIRSGIGRLISSAKSGRYRELTVREAWLNTLIGVEIYCWFFIGECIGKRHIVGYDV